MLDDDVLENLREIIPPLTKASGDRGKIEDVRI
jgi:hypothetical protein